ncbi:Cytochrome C biogenesis protein transmembrane region [Pedococcus dokdonensis]|uniref:Cytochrome C biogenesis protein transmembrane region n=1 Tax=Pedococcus dokdonensis TaxID=443156 RepID=A0A1H0TKX8_9MICO|nr:sulfite exporter TauE/SafE family protein [Pedococcus dokdonensis]SDP54435.1 Cytochrome C biogenesis protein transmembrane region [Pedococcus dokdonensis]
MLSSISPLGERARNSRWWLTTTAYLLGSLAGGLAVGGLAALLGSLVPDEARGSRWTLVAVAALLVIGLVVDLRNQRSVPSWRRQVDEQWLTRYRGWVYGVGFGAQLGFGLVTIITSTTTYAAVLLAALSGQVGAGLAIGATFGLVRALPSLLMAGVTDRDDLHRVFIRVERWANPAGTVAKVALGGAAAIVLVAAWWS